MTNAVETLAQAVCPECKGSGAHPNYTMPDIAGNRMSCSTCGGTGAAVPGLRVICGCRSVMYFDCHCEKRYWMLPPAAEVMGVLVRDCESVEIMRHSNGVFEITVVIGDSMFGGSFDVPEPEEALAAAILQALA